jgi:hypothetical protein
VYGTHSRAAGALGELGALVCPAAVTAAVARDVAARVARGEGLAGLLEPA